MKSLPRNPESFPTNETTDFLSNSRCDRHMQELFVSAGKINSYTAKHPKRIPAIVDTINETATNAGKNMETMGASADEILNSLNSDGAPLLADETLSWNVADGTNKLEEYIRERVQISPFNFNHENIESSEENEKMLENYLKELELHLKDAMEELVRLTDNFDPDKTEVIANESRIKYARSVKEKLKNKAAEGRDYTIGNMTDLIGTRIIVAGEGLITLENLTLYIQNYYGDRILEKNNKYQDKPSEQSYHAIHYIIKIDQTTCFELQLNTEGSRLISNVVHGTIYKQRETPAEHIDLIKKYHISNLINELGSYKKNIALIKMITMQTDNAELMRIENPDLLKYALNAAIENIPWTKEEKTAVIKAITYSEKAHGNDRRLEGTPYALHPFRIALRLLAGGETDSETIILALLHDVLEDGDIGIDEITEVFGKDIVQGLELLTKKTTAYRKTDEEYFSALMTAPDKIKKTKVHDRIDNLYSLSLINDPDRNKDYLQETRDFIVPLAESLNDGDLLILLQDAMDSVKIETVE